MIGLYTNTKAWSGTWQHKNVEWHLETGACPARLAAGGCARRPQLLQNAECYFDCRHSSINVDGSCILKGIESHLLLATFPTEPSAQTVRYRAPPCGCEACGIGALRPRQRRAACSCAPRDDGTAESPKDKGPRATPLEQHKDVGAPCCGRWQHMAALALQWTGIAYDVERFRASN